MQLKTQVAIEIARARGEVFRIATQTENLPKIFPGKGPIPGIREARMVGPGPVAAGSVREVVMSDGSTLRESFTAFSAPDGFSYQMSQLRPPLSLLVTTAGGRWEFSDQGGGTRITWTYTCDLTTVLVAPLAALVIKGFMKAAMAESLGLLKALIESSS